jgi:hypothetical protein
MGFFDDIKNTVASANQMQANASAMQANAANATMGGAVDLNDPMWAPIQGVTVDRYAQLTAQMARSNLSGIEAVQSWLEEQGVARGTWAEINSGWAQRMATYEHVRTRYGIIYSQS